MDTELNVLESEKGHEQLLSSEVFSQPMLKLLPQQQKNLELLSHLASYSELLIAVTGLTGVGKTTLANALSAHRETPEDTLFLQADLTTTSLVVLQQIAMSWDLPQLSENLVEAKDAVLTAAAARQQDGYSLLVIIDQAEQLEVDTLNEIAHLALLAPQALSFALFGASGYETGLRESPTQAPVHILQLEPLDYDSATSLAEQTFDQGTLKDSQLQFAYSRSGGLPGMFLKALEDQLLSGEQSDTSVKSKFPVLHIVAVAVVASVLGMSFLYQSPEGSDDSALLAPEQPDSAQLPASSGLVDKGADATTQPEELTGVDEPIFADNEKTELAAPQVAVIHEVPETQVLSSNANIAGDTDFNYQAEAEVPPSAAEAAKPVVEQPAETKSLVSEVPAASKAVVYSSDEQILMNADGYVIQLSGFHSEAGAKDFVSQWQSRLSNQLYTYRSSYKGKPWHVVVAGVYSDRAEATRAVKSMPKSLRDQTPWIKDVQMVKKILSDRQ